MPTDAHWWTDIIEYHWCIGPSDWQPRQIPHQKLMQRQLRMLYLPCYERHVLKHSLVMFWHELEPSCLNSLPWQGHLQCSGLHFLKILWKLPKSVTQLKSKQCWTMAGRCSPSWSGCKGNCECCLGMSWPCCQSCFDTCWWCFEVRMNTVFQASCLDGVHIVNLLDCSSGRSYEKCPKCLMNFKAHDVGLRHCRKMQPKLKLMKLKLRSVRGLSERRKIARAAWHENGTVQLK